jgi:hypothetical protein
MAAKNLELVENNIAKVKEMTTYAEKVRVEVCCLPPIHRRAL